MWKISVIYKKGGLQDSRNFSYESEHKPTHEELLQTISINSASYCIVEELVLQ